MTNGVQTKRLIELRAFRFSWSCAGGRVETDKGLVDGGTSILTEADRLFVLVVRQLLMRRRFLIRERPVGRVGAGLKTERERHVFTSRVVGADGALFESHGFCELSIETLFLELCLGDGAVVGDKVSIVKGLKKNATGDALPYACNLGDEFSNDSENDTVD